MNPYSVVAILWSVSTNRAITGGPYIGTAEPWNGPKILAVSRKTDHADLGLPGGKVEPGETPEAALIREVFEETSLRLTNLQVVFEHLDRVAGAERRPCRCFSATWEGEAVSMEGARVEWVLPKDLVTPACSFAEYNRRLFAALGVTP